jgi:hypothetical protein
MADGFDVQVNEMDEDGLPKVKVGTVTDALSGDRAMAIKVLNCPFYVIETPDELAATILALTTVGKAVFGAQAVRDGLVKLIAHELN